MEASTAALLIKRGLLRRERGRERQKRIKSGSVFPVERVCECMYVHVRYTGCPGKIDTLLKSILRIIVHHFDLNKHQILLIYTLSFQMRHFLPKLDKVCKNYIII